MHNGAKEHFEAVVVGSGFGSQNCHDACADQRNVFEGTMRRIAHSIVKAWRASAPGLVAGLAVLPGAIALSTAVFFFGDVPHASGVNQVVLGAIAGVLLWLASCPIAMGLRGGPTGSRF